MVTSIPGSKYAYTINFHASKSAHNLLSNGSRWTLVLSCGSSWKFCDTRGSRWKYIGVYVSSWKLPPNMVVEAAIDGSNGSFH